jgi:photosystem II stability/assembly factor-like uncharacterized protein
VCLVATAALAVSVITADEVRQNLLATCFINENEGWIAGELGRIFHTTDGGKTFARAETGTQRGLLAVACFPNKTVIAAGQLGIAIRSRDGGATWEPLTTNTKRSLLSIAFATPEVGVIIGDFGTIIRTADGGTTWETIPMPEQINLPADIVDIVAPGDVLLYDVSFTSATHGVAVGEFGTIFTTADAGKTWVSQKSPIESTLFGVGFADDGQRGWAVGLESIMIGTRDGGLTWQKEQIPSPKGYFLALYDVAVSGQFGWAIGDRGLLMQTTDGGATWKLVDVPIRLAGSWFRGLSLGPDATGFIVGNRGIMLATQRDTFRELERADTPARRVDQEG